MGFGDYNIQQGNGHKEKLGDIKHGVRKEQLDNKYQALFDAYDANKDGTLEAEELDNIFKGLQNFAGSDRVLDANENALVKSIFAEQVNIQDVDFQGFVKSVSDASAAILSSSEKQTPDGGKEVTTTYNDGTTETIAFYSNGDYKWKKTEKRTLETSFELIIDGKKHKFNDETKFKKALETQEQKNISNAMQNAQNKQKASQSTDGISKYIKLPVATINTNTYSKENIDSKESYSPRFIAETLGVNTETEDGKKVVERLSYLPQEALEKLKDGKELKELISSQELEPTFDNISNILEITEGVTLRNEEEYKATEVQRQEILTQIKAANFMANLYETLASYNDQYTDSVGLFGLGSEGIGYVLNKLGLDGENHYQWADSCREFAKNASELKVLNPQKFKEGFKKIYGKTADKYGIDYNSDAFKKCFALAENGKAFDKDNKMTDEYKEAILKAMNIVADDPNDSTFNQVMNGIGEVLIMVATFGWGAETKAGTTLAMSTMSTFSKAGVAIASKQVSNKLLQGALRLSGQAVKLIGPALNEGTKMYLYTAAEGTVMNVSNRAIKQDGFDKLLDTQAQVMTNADGSFTFGAFAGVFGSTVTQKVMQRASKVASKVTTALSEKFSQGTVNANEVFATILEKSAPTKIAEAAAFATDVVGFTAFESALSIANTLQREGTLTPEKLADTLMEEFGHQGYSLGQIKVISHLIMMLTGSRSARMQSQKYLQENLPQLKGATVEGVNGGKDGFKINLPDGRRIECKNASEMISSLQLMVRGETAFSSKFDKVREAKAETNSVPHPNPLPQGAREQGGVRAEKSSKLVGDNVSVASAVEFSKFKTNRRIKGFDKNLNPSQMTEAELQAKKQVEEYLKNNFPDLATQDNINILKDAWLKSPEFTQKALNNSRKFNVTEIFSLVEAYQLEPNLTEKYLNIKSENGAYRFHPFAVKYLVKAHLTDATRTEELINTKQENGQYKYDGIEVLSLVEAYQMNTKATDMLLNLKNEKGKSRFQAGAIKFLVEAYNKNPELVEDLLTQEYYKGMIRHKAQNIVDAVKAYEIDPKRFKEILDEKGQPPYDYAYMHDGSDALKFIEAEQIDSKVAKMLEAQHLEGGLPRFTPEMIRSLTEVYNEHPKTLDRILNIKNINGVYKFLSGESIPDKDYFNSILEKCEKYPEILEIAKNNETISGFNSLCALCNSYEKNPEFVKNSLNKKNTNGSPRFDIMQVDYLMVANETNPTLTKEALDVKTADGKEYRFNAYEVRGLIEADKINHELTSDLLTQKKSDGSYYSGSEIREIVSAREASPDIYDGAIKNGFSDVDAAKIVAAFKQSKDPDLVKLLMGYKNSEGKSKFDGQDIIRIVLTIDNAPNDKAKILDYLNNDISMNSIDGLLEMEKILSRDEFDKLKNSFNTIVDYCKAHNIKYDNLLILENKEFLVLLDENGNSSIMFDADGKMIQESILDATNPNFNKERLVNKNGDKSVLARVEYEQLGFTDFAFYTDNIQTIKDVNGNFLYKEFCLKSKDVEGKFDVWREEANGKKYKIGLAEKTPAGEIVLEKTLVANDGTKTDYNYMQSPDGSRLVYTKITEPDGKVTENRQQFKVIDNNHAVSIENGMKYEIEYQTDKITVTKDNGEKVELSIGSNEIESEGIISKDLLPIVKMLPGSALCDIKEFGLKKLWLNTDKAQEGNAMFIASTGTIELSKQNSVPKNVFVLLHELGHYRDYFKFRENKELNDIFKVELEAFNNSATRVDAAAISYLIATGILKPGGMQQEFIAETNAIMHSSNYAPYIEMRGQCLQKYFPKTFAKVVELLKETGVQEYKPEE